MQNRFRTTLTAAFLCCGLSAIPHVARASQPEVRWLSICPACPSNPFGITENGAVSGNVSTPQGERGFLLSRGEVTYVDVPGHFLIELLKGNNRGEFVGTYFSTADFKVHGFVRAKNGALRDVTFPEAPTTVMHSINAVGVGLGCYTNDPTLETGWVSFLEWNGRFPFTFKYPDPQAHSTIALGFNGQGSIVGAFIREGSPALHAFERRPDGKFSEITFPAAGETYLADINEWGAAVGFWRDRSGTYRGLAYHNGLCYSVDLPLSPSGYTNATLNGINNRGSAVGVAFPQSPGDGDGFMITGLQHGNGAVIAGAGIPCKQPYPGQ